ncbi:MAG: hypothetical protein ABUT20_36615, partial [Bacteroidota bacterium]
MLKRIITFSLFLITGFSAWCQEKALTKGMKFSNSATVKNKIYTIDASTDLSNPVVLIEGNNITIDFKNAVLQGSNTKANPDDFFGVAVLIQNSKKVTV